MNYIKFQQDLLKQIAKEPNSAAYFETDSQCFVSPNRYYLMGIPKELFFLDKEKILSGKSYNGNRLFKALDKSKPAIDTRTIVKRDKRTLRKFLVDDITIHIDTAFLKYFDMDNSQFRGVSGESPLFILENNLLVGIIMPVFIKETEVK